MITVVIVLLPVFTVLQLRLNNGYRRVTRSSELDFVDGRKPSGVFALLQTIPNTIEDRADLILNLGGEPDRFTEVRPF